MILSRPTETRMTRRFWAIFVAMATKLRLAPPSVRSFVQFSKCYDCNYASLEPGYEPITTDDSEFDPVTLQNAICDAHLSEMQLSSVNINR